MKIHQSRPPYSDVAIQREYYTLNADCYDQKHVHEDDAHNIALCWLSSILDFTGARSVLDIGSGTGRALSYLIPKHPSVRVVGIEPVAALRAKGHEKGINAEALLEGDATSLSYPDGSFDITCAFGTLHHIRHSNKAVEEMTRVARLGVFISDGNCFAQGSVTARLLKQLLHTLRLWPFAKYVKTGGKGYHYSEGDGVFYSYSIFDEITILERKFPVIYKMTSVPSGLNLYRTASHLALFARRLPPDQKHREYTD
ncbi:MAG: methyltransferase domain-containing protein [Deltaproteobacteria bacterium]|nr:methyltransferase domain-containing protein [Deltaproteobacteria bacterium]